MCFSSPGLEKLTYYLALFLGARSGRLPPKVERNNIGGPKKRRDVQQVREIARNAM
jgi:hypothetical protein